MERINREALFSDETEDYRHPCEADAGQEVIFYFRTERDGADAVYLIEYDKQDRMKERDMEYSHSDSLFDYYRCKYILGEEVLNTASGRTGRRISVSTAVWGRQISRRGRQRFI